MATTPLTRITPLEYEMLAAARSLEPNEVKGDAIHLHIEHGRRRWLVTTPRGEFWATIDDAELDPSLDVHLPLSDRVTSFLGTVSRAEPKLAVADGSTAVFSTDEVWAGIDLVPWTGPAPRPGSVRTTASATLPLWDFIFMLTAARVMPSGADEQHAPSPPMWLSIHDGGASLHVDWRDFLPSRATYTLSASSMNGAGTIALPHRRVDGFLNGLGMAHTTEDDDVMVEVGIGELNREGVWLPVVTLTCGSWCVAMIAPNVLAERWHDKVETQLEPFQVIDRGPLEWSLDVQGHPIHVRLHGGHPDVVRVSTAVGTGFEETLELLRELSTLNAASVGVRFWLEHDTVWAALDLPCTQLSELGDTVRAVNEASVNYSPLLRVWC